MAANKKTTDTGLSRKIDVLGRIVIPKGLRESLGFGPDTLIHFFRNSEGLVLTKSTGPTCLFCGTQSNLSVFKGNHVCTRCRKAMG